ncbi:SGL domain containing protein, partial [Asbolus verrucosus]
TQGLASEIQKTQPLGSLYTFDSKRHLTKHVDKIRIANGLPFNEEIKKMYYIDSLAGTVDQFDFHLTTNRQVLFTLKKHNIPRMPDGMTIDTDGNLWITSTAFERKNLDELHVTTGAFEIDGQKLPPPANGAIYKITKTG